MAVLLMPTQLLFVERLKWLAASGFAEGALAGAANHCLVLTFCAWVGGGKAGLAPRGLGRQLGTPRWGLFCSQSESQLGDEPQGELPVSNVDGEHVSRSLSRSLCGIAPIVGDSNDESVECVASAGWSPSIVEDTFGPRPFGGCTLGWKWACIWGREYAGASFFGGFHESRPSNAGGASRASSAAIFGVPRSTRMSATLASPSGPGADSMLDAVDGVGSTFMLSSRGWQSSIPAPRAD